MIKTNKTNVKDTPPATIASAVLERLVEVGNPQKSSLARTVEQLGSSIRTSEQERSNTRDAINRAYREMIQKQERERLEKHELLKAKNKLDAFDDSETRERMTTMVHNISKLRYVDNVTVDGDRIIVQTRLIFTDVRKESGSRDYVRRCIGAFEIMILSTDERFLISNMLFERINNPHWTVGSAGNPCYGEHEDYFVEALQNRDYFMLLEYIYAFLRSTDDGAAYLPSNNWIDNRNEMYENSARPSIRKGNYVVVHTPYSQYNPFEHCIYGKVIRCDYGDVYVEFKRPFEFGHNMRGLCDEGHGYRVPLNNVAKISKKEFDDESVTLEEILNHNPLEQLDSLPFGSTLQDAKKII